MMVPMRRNARTHRAVVALIVMLLGIALGFSIGSVLASIWVVAGFLSASIQMSILSAAVFSVSAAIVGGLAGALTGFSAWFVAAVALLVACPFLATRALRATVVTLGSACGALVVMVVLASRPEVELGPAGVLIVVLLALLAGMLAAGAYVTAERNLACSSQSRVQV